MFRRPSLEVHVPISPTPIFLNLIHYLTHSLRQKRRTLPECTSHSHDW